MTTNKQMFDVADKMAAAIVKLTKGLATDGTALEGFIDAMNVQNEWAAIKLKRSMERMCRRVGVVSNFEHELPKELQTEALNKHNVMESLPLAAKDYAKKILEETDYSAGKIHLEQAFIEGAKFLSGNAP